MRTTRPFKRFRSWRVLLSLATCSIVLVIFGATVYALALPGALPHQMSDSVADSSTMVETEFSTGSNEGDEGQAGDLVDTNTAGVSGSLDGAPIMPQEQGQSQAQGQASSSKSVATSSALDAETEKVFHDHIAKYYAQAKSDYDYLCKGLNNLYSTMSSQAQVSSSPVDAASFIWTVDARRAALLDCTYKGNQIDGRSKWYTEYEKVATLYENLVNVCSIMREVNGLDSATARERLAYYSNASGKIRELAAFEQNYGKIRL